MSVDFFIEFAPNGDQLRLNLRSRDVAQAGKPFTRQSIDLLPDEVNKLRAGTANPLIVDNITAAVSQWLLGDALGDDLQRAIEDADSERLRVVLSVNDEQLQEKLSDIPFELCQPAGALGAIPVALETGVESIIHLLPKIGVPPVSPKDRFPLNILIVRSNPADLGGAVPAAAPLRKEIHKIIDAHGKLNRSHVQVHILSSEADPDLHGRPTYKDLRTHLESDTSYDILIYLGHGDVLQSYPGKPPVGVLQFESEETGDADSDSFDSVAFTRLARLLNRHAVPVVLLVGCLTASEVPVGKQEYVESNTPAWMRGSQAVAQALINSSSGVKVVVGMRYRLEKDDAKHFLKGFFKSLLKMRPGNVEAAVHQARNEMSDANQNSYSWSSPMVFRSLEPEPLFPFLASPPEAVCPNTQQQQSLRETFWTHLSKLTWSLRNNPQSGAESVHSLLMKTVEKEYVQTVLASAPLLLPGCVEGHYEQEVTVPVTMHGQLKVESLRGDLSFGGQLSVISVAATQALLDSGYKLLSSTEENSASFSIERKTGDADLPEGTLFNVTVKLGQTYPAIYPMNINILKTESAKAICTGNNVVIVPPP
ncbi:MAG TPA: CHAT domain-containing protein [Pyrinomonadaceae bacterium]|nr:CHAT domain-containing protein [Pyrinomonadaceae bacterium]